MTTSRLFLGAGVIGLAVQGRQFGPPQSTPSSFPLRDPSAHDAKLPGKNTHNVPSAV